MFQKKHTIPSKMNWFMTVLAYGSSNSLLIINTQFSGFEFNNVSKDYNPTNNTTGTGAELKMSAQIIQTMRMICNTACEQA